MLTNPNTLGLFEEDIEAMASAVHDVGGLLYYDGANLNAIVGVVRPGDMGFDIVHLNLHKTFATPHGGGGPGAGPVAVSARLAEFLPGPRPVRGAGEDGDHAYGWFTTAEVDRPNPLLARQRARACPGPRLHPGPRRRRSAWRSAHGRAERQLAATPTVGGTFDIPYDRPCMHELVLSAKSLKKDTGVKALDVAKRLLEKGFHSPTVYFPLIVDEALMVEPTETESLQTLEALATALEEIVAEAAADGGAEQAAHAPHATPVRRVDEARAARTLVPTFDARP